jgi:hypothetical protein
MKKTFNFNMRSVFLDQHFARPRPYQYQCGNFSSCILYLQKCNQRCSTFNVAQYQYIMDSFYLQPFNKWRHYYESPALFLTNSLYWSAKRAHT